MQLDTVRIERKGGKLLFYSAPNPTLIEDFDKQLEAFLWAAVESVQQRKAFAATQQQLARISRMTR